MLGLTFDKLVIIAVIAAFLLGPQRLPAAAAGLGRLVRTLRNLAKDTTGRIREEAGPEFDDFDWARLDPRQYDPRRIIRDALTSDEEPADVSAGEAAATQRADPPRASSPSERGTPWPQ
jgi:sec-independent protein translocase protein TatB